MHSLLLIINLKNQEMDEVHGVNDLKTLNTDWDAA
jgi:hypothetical protein